MQSTLITGAGGALGSELTSEFLAAGYQVIAVDKDRESLARLRDVTDPLWVDRLDVRVCDLSNEDQVSVLAGGLTSDYGSISCAVLAAGIMHEGRLRDIRIDDLLDVFDVNVVSQLRLLQSCLPLLERAPEASVAFIGSTLPQHPMPSSLAYSASKAALITVAKTLSIDLAEAGIRVNVVSPGAFQSPLLHRLATNESEHIDLLSSRPLGRFTTPTEVAAATLFLASASAAGISGMEFCVDGAARNLHPNLVGKLSARKDWS